MQVRYQLRQRPLIRSTLAGRYRGGIEHDGAGGLGVPHLRSVWEQAMERRAGGAVGPSDGTRFAIDAYVTHQLGLPLEETLLYLGTGPSWDEFAAWVVDQRGGSVEPRLASRINAVVNGTPYDEQTQAWIDAVDAAPPVLSDDDLAHWDDLGYVVLHEAISHHDARAAEAVVWEHLGMDPSDPDAWYSAPRSHAIMVQLFHHPAFDVARTSPRVHKAFAQLSGTADLFSTTDRCSFNPPERPGWEFPGPFLHWDVHLEPPIPFGVQGVLYLTDTTAEQGAFSCVPGFHRKIDGWLQTADEHARNNPSDLDPSGGTPVPGVAGDLVIWHQALPHGSRPNRAARPRIVQYVAMHPPPGRQAR
jgi:hypothetical protein